jgi:hypothetical protein
VSRPRKQNGEIVKRPYCCVEWALIADDPRFWRLPAAQRFAYLALWSYAKEKRQDRLPLKDVSRMVACSCHLDPRLVARMLQNGCKAGLLHIEDRTTLIVDGVRDMHKSLAGWDHDDHDHDERSEEIRRERARAREGQAPLRTLRWQIKTGQITGAVPPRSEYPLPVSVTDNKITIHGPNGDHIVVRWADAQRFIWR